MPLFFLFFVGLLGCSKELRTLSGEEAQALFSDKTVSGKHEKHGYSFISYYEPTGTFRSYQDGSKTPQLGKWWIRNDTICIRWQEEKEDLCRHMMTDDNNKYWKYLIKNNGKQVKIVTFNSFEPGNPNNL